MFAILHQLPKIVKKINAIEFSEGTTVIMKAISPPSMDEYDDLVEEARKQARKAGLKQANLDSLIAEVRSRG